MLLGIIEGLTEFLPVSSTGHLLLLEHFLQDRFTLEQRSDLFNTVIQCGAVLAVLVVFAGRLRALFRQWRSPWAREYLVKLAVAFVITLVGGLALKLSGMALPRTTGPVAWATAIGGLAILAIEAMVGKARHTGPILWPGVVAIGCAQVLAAAFPGTSRSAATILAAMLFGASRRQAVEFSFLLGIPTILSAGALQVAWTLRGLGKVSAGPSEDWAQLAFSAIVAAITAFLAVRWLLGFIQTHTFRPFAWYRLALGGAILASGLMQ